jgi:hypothetical protein
MSGIGTELLCHTAFQLVHVPDQKWSLLEKSGRLFRLLKFRIDLVALGNIVPEGDVRNNSIIDIGVGV